MIKYIIIIICAFSRAQERVMNFSLLSVAFIAIFLSITAAQVYKGYKFGLLKSLINAALAIFSLFIGIFIATRIAPSISKLILDELESSGALDGLFGNDLDLTAVFSALSSMLVSMLVFPLVFFLLRLILTIFSPLIYKPLSSKSSSADSPYTDENAPEHIKHSGKLGAVAGILTGYIITLVLLSPLVGAFGATQKIFRIIETYSEGEGDLGEISEEVTFYSNDAASVVLGYCGANAIFDLATTTKIAGERTSLNRELDAISRLNVMALMESISNFTNMTPEAKEEIDASLSVIEDSALIKSLVADALSSASKAWLDGNTFMGMSRPNLGEDSVVESLVVQLLEICATSTTYTIVPDISTLINLSSIISEAEGLLSASNYEEFARELSKNNIVAKIEYEIDLNPHMRPIMTFIKDMTMQTLVTELKDNINYTDEEYEQLLSGLAESLTEVKNLNEILQDSAMKDEAKQHLENMGIDVPDEIIDTVSNTLLEEFAKEEEVSYEMIEAFLNSYLNK